jgi:hypothetical protein
MLTVTNNGPAQKIHIGAHVWQERTYGENNANCYDVLFYSQPHRIWDKTANNTSENTNYHFDAYFGSVWMEAIDFEEGETREIGAMFDWTV